MSDQRMIGPSGYERREHEAYFSPPWVTRALIREVGFSEGKVWEPACGNGAMSKVLIAAGYDVVSTDLVDHGYGQAGVDFLTAPIPPEVKHVVTNPPYKQAQKFIERSLEIINQTSGKAAFLLRNEFDSAAGRRHIFSHPLYARKWILRKRPRWIEGSTGSPRHNYAWFIWDAAHEGPATIRYLEGPVETELV